jgi:hypothetical protein
VKNESKQCHADEVFGSIRHRETRHTGRDFNGKRGGGFLFCYN